jgi:hypothetical protein
MEGNFLKDVNSHFSVKGEGIFTLLSNGLKSGRDGELKIKIFQWGVICPKPTNYRCVDIFPWRQLLPLINHQRCWPKKAAAQICAAAFFRV